MSPKRRYRVTIGDKVYEVEVDVKDPRDLREGLLRLVPRARVVERRAPRPATAGNVVRAPISGRVVKVLVREGDKVEGGQALAVIESMKTHIEVTSDGDGVVRRVLVREGDFVRTNQEIVVLGKGEG